MLPPSTLANLIFIQSASKFVNGCLIIGGIVVSVIASSYDFPCLISHYLKSNSVVYYFVQNEIQILNGGRTTADRLDAEATDGEEGEPLLTLP